MKFVLATAIAFVLVSPVGAADKGKGVDADHQKEKKICKTETVTGSLTRKKRTCMTAEEWRELTQKTQQNIDAFTKDAALPQQSANPLGG